MSRIVARPTLLIALSLLTITPAFAGTEAFDRQMASIQAEYARIHRALAGDNLDGVADAARRIVTLSGQLDPSTVTGEHADHYQALPSKIQTAAARLADATDLQAARAAFKDLSKPMAMWVTMSRPDGLNVVYCSMAKGSWIQQGTTILNPYEGSSMLHCGEIVSGAHTGHGGMEHGAMKRGDTTMQH